jgi:hypothetical protein
MEFIKEHKFMVVTLVLFLLMLFAGGILTYKLFFSYGNDKYGDRLKPIENLKINDHTIKKLESELKELEHVEKVTTNINGKLINVMFTVDKDLDKGKAKEHGDKVLSYFSEEERKNYDIQIFVMTKEIKEEEGYSIIGYVRAGKEAIEWSNN